MYTTWGEVAVADAWVIVCDELVAVIREGGMTATAVDFSKSTDTRKEPKCR